MKYGLVASTFKKEEKRAMMKVIESDNFSMGRHVAEFEEQFAMYFGMKHAVMVSSGSSANLVAIASLFYRTGDPLKKGDEVIVPNISWATTYYPLLQYGLKLKFVDVELDTLNMDVNELRKAISKKTRMVITVSVLGNPCRLDEIKRLCDSNGIILFEDNCESMGATVRNKFAGTFGLINTFSTFFSHHISTMEGGLILTNDDNLNWLCRSIRNHGWTRGIPASSGLYSPADNDFDNAYRFILPGYNVRPGELNGVLGKIQLKRLTGFLKVRRKNADIFQQLFAKDERFIIQKEIGSSSWFAFTMIVNPDTKIKRDKVLLKLNKAGIEHRMITGGCFLRHDVIKYFDRVVTKSVNADLAHFNGFFVGNFPVDLRSKLEYLHKTLKSI